MKREKKDIKGVAVLPVTPFTQDFRIDEEAYIKNLDYYANIGVDGVMVNGSIGEFSSLSIQERKRMLEITIEHLNDKIYVGSCTSSDNTREVIELTRHAKEVGASVVMITPPYYWKPTDADIYQHYKLINDAVSIPIMLYNNPFLSKVNLKNELVEKLVKNLDNVKYMKETVRGYTNLYRRVETGIGLFAGSPGMFLPALEFGALGATASPLHAKETVELYRAFQQGSLKEALRLQKKLIHMYPGGEELLNFLPWIKAACDIRGIVAGPPRPPYKELTDEEKADLRRSLEQFEYL